MALELTKTTRETDNLGEIPDSCQKIVVTGKFLDVGMVDGIPIIHIIDFVTNGLPKY